MNRFQIIDKKEIQDKLTEQFGIKEIPGILLTRGAERIFLYQGDLTEKDIAKLENNKFSLERIGMYFGKEQNNLIRLSIDAIHLLQDQITKNIFELNDEQVNEWLHGSELNIETGKKEFLIMKYKNDFLGCGKASELKISNFIPKNRRLKFKN